MDGDELSAALVSGPSNGTLSLQGTGGFSYTPAPGFSGLDSFSYQVNDGSTPGNIATVNIRTFQPGCFFSDDFNRPANLLNSLFPWVAVAGNWSPVGGTLHGTLSTPGSYGLIYLTNTWPNYTVQARVQFPTGAFGGGIDGRVQVGTGARYAAWVYPETSPSGTGLLRLIKFQTLSDWGYNGTGFAPIGMATLPTVGTNWHTLRLDFSSNHISVFYEGNLMISADDAESGPYLSGGAGIDTTEQRADAALPG
jgi:hypothetical protein